MNDRELQFKELRNKVEKLINLHELLVKENQQLKANHSLLTQTIDHQGKQIAELEDKNKVMKLANAVSGGTDQNNRDIKLKINEYIREIDKCLALINR